MAGEWPDYAAFILHQPCVVCGTRIQVQGHHATNGLTHPPGERPPKSVGGKRGKGQRAHDWYLIPLCIKHHAELHDSTRRKGAFKDFSNQRMSAWQLEQVTEMRCRWEAQQPDSEQQWLDSLPF